MRSCDDAIDKIRRSLNFLEHLNEEEGGGRGNANAGDGAVAKDGGAPSTHADNIESSVSVLLSLLSSSSSAELKQSLIKHVRVELSKPENFLESFMESMKLVSFEGRKTVTGFACVVLEKEKACKHGVDGCRCCDGKVPLGNVSSTSKNNDAALSDGCNCMPSHLFISDQTIKTIIKNSTMAELSIPASRILRTLASYCNVHSRLLKMDDFMDVYCKGGLLNTNFEVSSECFQSLRLLLLNTDTSISSNYLISDYTTLMDNFYTTMLLKSTPPYNYVTLLLSLNLLQSLLLERKNFKFMMRYISSSTNLTAILELLRFPKEKIRMASYHIFKVFVANPRKTSDVERILKLNWRKLKDFIIANVKSDEGGDSNWEKERDVVVNCLEELGKVEEEEKRNRAAQK